MSKRRLVRVGAIQPVRKCVNLTGFKKKKALETINENVEHICRLLKKAANENIDIICTPEDIMGLSPLTIDPKNKNVFANLVENLADRTLKKICLTARDLNINVVSACYLPDTDGIFNTAFLIDRNGKNIGRYRKTHLPPGEDKMVVTGNDYPVFKTDFGKVAMLICWDMMFPETTRIVSLKGAEIIFHPTLGFDFGGEHMGEMRLRVRAFDNTVYIVTAMPADEHEKGPGRSCIIDFQGHILTDAGYAADKIIWTDIDLSRKPADLTDPENKEGFDMQLRFTKCRRPQTYGRIIER